MNFAALSFNSPVGILTLFEIDGGVCALEWGRPPEDIPTNMLTNAIAQMEEYFDGKRKKFNIIFKPAGTSFQQKVWKALQAIPYGEVITYGDLAKRLNSSPRAVGMACGTNPVPILIPCHRVVATDGKLNGYSGEGGLTTKANLLRLEGLNVSEDNSLVL
ncbi:MAG: methylated-DNA--[protein]-cysteine S-methyltransferase [Alphaproteobacteria bacterium]